MLLGSTLHIFQNYSFEMSSNIEVIGEWIRKETLFFGQTDELFIATFLQFCNNDVEKTKERVVRYYELRKQYPRVMRNRDILNEKHGNLFRQKIFYCDFENESCNLPVVFAMKISRLQPYDNLYDASKAAIFLAESVLFDSARIRKYGGIIILDLADVTFTRAIQFTPNLFLQALRCLFEGVPLKICAIFVINIGSIVRAAYSVASVFLPTEIRNIVTVSGGSWERISDKVPRQCLPIDYGGTNGTLEENVEHCEAVLLRWRDYLVSDEQYGFNDMKQES